MRRLLPRVLAIVGHLGRLALAGVFLYAGALKALDPEGFAQEIVQYGILSGPIAGVFAYVLIVVELAVGVSLLLDWLTMPSLMVACGLLVVFIGAIGYALATDQPLQGCGCFGRNTPRSPQQTITEDLAFLAAGLLGLVGLRGRSPRTGGGRWKKAVVAGTAVLSSAFVVAAPHMPIDDLATGLRPGVRWRDLGIALAEVDLGQGAHLVALLSMKEEASAAALASLDPLARQVDLVGLYSDDDEAYNEFFWTNGPSFPLYHIAPSDMRRLHRRLPRLFAIKDGVVTRTWSEPPAEEEVARALGT